MGEILRKLGLPPEVVFSPELTKVVAELDIALIGSEILVCKNFDEPMPARCTPIDLREAKDLATELLRAVKIILQVKLRKTLDLLHYYEERLLGDTFDSEYLAIENTREIVKEMKEYIEEFDKYKNTIDKLEAIILTLEKLEVKEER